MLIIMTLKRALSLSYVTYSYINYHVMSVQVTVTHMRRFLGPHVRGVCLSAAPFDAQGDHYYPVILLYLVGVSTSSDESSPAHSCLFESRPVFQLPQHVHRGFFRFLTRYSRLILVHSAHQNVSEALRLLSVHMT